MLVDQELGVRVVEEGEHGQVLLGGLLFIYVVGRKTSVYLTVL